MKKNREREKFSNYDDEGKQLGKEEIANGLTD